MFCKRDSASSRSVEHVIPESLGNTKAILPPGIVCDACNNYFARKVEAPFLHSPAVLSLRFRQRLQNKKGRVPSLLGTVLPDVPAKLHYFPKIDRSLIEVAGDALPRLERRSHLEADFPLGATSPAGKIVSRFFAKVALESMVRLYAPYPGGLTYLSAEPQLDPLRDHARVGRIDHWPVHIRHLYSADGAILEQGELRQIVHESDFLMTPWGEWFHVVAIFGLEFTINLGGPEIGGYRRWLDENGGASPLYAGNNRFGNRMPQNIG